MKHLIACVDCQGKGERIYRYYDKKEKVRIEEIKTCKTCNGKGKVVRKKTYYKYRLLELIRLTDYYWKILKHKIPLPIEYLYNPTDECAACNGTGFIENRIQSEDGKKTVIKEVKCNKCKGSGIVKTIKDMYGEIFNSYINCKKQKQEIKEILKNKEWEKDEYKEYKEYFPIKHFQVCIRCSNYLDGTDNMGGMNSCCGCVNECGSNDNGYSYFVPINDKAKEWYNNGGYKFNLCYDANHDYSIK